MRTRYMPPGRGPTTINAPRLSRNLVRSAMFTALGPDLPPVLAAPRSGGVRSASARLRADSTLTEWSYAPTAALAQIKLGISAHPAIGRDDQAFGRNIFQ